LSRLGFGRSEHIEGPNDARARHGAKRNRLSFQVERGEARGEVWIPSRGGEADPRVVSLLAMDRRSGREVEGRGADEATSAGVHDVIWRGTDESGRRVASGVYLASLTAQGQVLSQRMILVE